MYHCEVSCEFFALNYSVNLSHNIIILIKILFFYQQRKKQLPWLEGFCLIPNITKQILLIPNESRGRYGFHFAKATL